MPAEITAQTVDVSNSPAPKPHSSFRLLFLILLIATLLSAVSTTYIILNWNVKNPKTPETSQKIEDNVFVSDTSENPFTEENNSSVETETPFSDNLSTNPFSDFETESDSTSTGEYVNPF